MYPDVIQAEILATRKTYQSSDLRIKKDIFGKWIYYLHDLAAVANENITMLPHSMSNVMLILYNWH